MLFMIANWDTITLLIISAIFSLFRLKLVLNNQSMYCNITKLVILPYCTFWHNGILKDYGIS